LAGKRNGKSPKENSGAKNVPFLSGLEKKKENVTGRADDRHRGENKIQLFEDSSPMRKGTGMGGEKKERSRKNISGGGFTGDPGLSRKGGKFLWTGRLGRPIRKKMAEENTGAKIKRRLR